MIADLFFIKRLFFRSDSIIKEFSPFCYIQFVMSRVGIFLDFIFRKEPVTRLFYLGRKDRFHGKTFNMTGRIYAQCLIV
jgi:hypothetical protein